MRRIFISYRREDAEGEAGRLFEDLTRSFGEGSVFLDVAAIEMGRDFRKAIDESVKGCGVLLALIGKDWLDSKDAGGHLRLHDPFDFVRLETASALRREIPVVPVLVQGAKMPRPEQLPEDLKELAYRNGVELTHARWRSDLDLLIQALSPHAAPTEEPKENANGSKTKSHRSKSRWAVPAVALGTLALASIAYLSWRKPPIVPDAPGIKVPVLVEVPNLTGKPLDVALSALRGLDLAVGNISREPNAAAPKNTILDEFPRAGTRVEPGTVMNLLVSDPASKPKPARDAKVVTPALDIKPAPPTLDVKSAAQPELPNFAGTWQMFEAALNGKPEDMSHPKTILITQHGAAVRLPSRELNITGDGTLVFQKFYVADGKGWREIASKGQADLVDDITWRAEGSSLKCEIAHDSKVNYRGNPPGRYVEIATFRQVDPSAALSQTAPSYEPSSSPSPTPSAQVAKAQPQRSWPKFAGTWQMFEATINGAPNKNFANAWPNSMTITQDGGRVLFMGQYRGIADTGVLRYSMYAREKNSGNTVTNRDQPDSVASAMWQVEGGVLVGRILYEFKRQFHGHPAGSTDLGIAKYRRVAR